MFDNSNILNVRIPYNHFMLNCGTFHHQFPQSKLENKTKEKGPICGLNVLSWFDNLAIE
jgi:hypothetical protein